MEAEQKIFDVKAVRTIHADAKKTQFYTNEEVAERITKAAQAGLLVHFRGPDSTRANDSNDKSISDKQIEALEDAGFGVSTSEANGTIRVSWSLENVLDYRRTHDARSSFLE